MAIDSMAELAEKLLKLPENNVYVDSGAPLFSFRMTGRRLIVVTRSNVFNYARLAYEDIYQVGHVGDITERLLHELASKTIPELKIGRLKPPCELPAPPGPDEYWRS